MLMPLKLKSLNLSDIIDMSLTRSSAKMMVTLHTSQKLLRNDYGVNFSMSEEEDKKFYPIKELSVFVSNETVFAMRFDELTEKSYYRSEGAHV